MVFGPAMLICIAFRLYLNPEGFQFGPGLPRILVMNHVHPQPARVFQIQRAVVNERALLRWTLRGPGLTQT